MTNKKRFLVMLVVVIAFGFSLSGCATYATRGGNVTPIGFFTPTIQTEGGREIVATYTVILGLFTIGYDSFIVQTDGIEVDIIDSNVLGLYREVIAVRR
jgi:hypothetical protein